MEQPWLDTTQTGQTKPAAAHPIFTDPSGRRRRLMLIAGAGASMLCVAALIVVGTGLVGGPNTPFTLWGAPHSPAGHSHASRAAHTGKSGQPPQPGLTSQQASQRSGGPGATPSPKADPTPTPTTAPTPSVSPTPSRTPPGQGKSRTPRSHTPNSHSPSSKPHLALFAHVG